MMMRRMMMIMTRRIIMMMIMRIILMTMKKKAPILIMMTKMVKRLEKRYLVTTVDAPRHCSNLKVGLLVKMTMLVMKSHCFDL